MAQDKLTTTALQVLEKRVLRGEDPETMFHRVASAVASAEKEDRTYWENAFYSVMRNLDFLPNSPTLMNAGRRLGQLQACFVLPVEDSIEGIFTAVGMMAEVQKSGGGTGFSFSRLRPKGDPVDTTYGVASGPVSFMRVFNISTEVIKQGGARRGANMAVLRVDHPDIFDFIKCKDVEGEFSNFNISVGLTKEFMEAWEEDGTITLRHHRRDYREVRAREIAAAIVEQAWRNGEPGVVFLDRINSANPTPQLGELEGTNPCGEQPLLPLESCNLGSINLRNMVNDYNYEDYTPFNWDLLGSTVEIAVRFLDDVIDVNKYPYPQIEALAKGNRKIGLGVMGWADALFAMKIPYDSPEALKAAEGIMSFIQEKAYETSALLGAEKGSFSNIGKSIFRGTTRRNATLTTIAPTGTLSMIAGVSSGIEPIFALAYTKTVLEGTEFKELNPIFLEYVNLSRHSAGEIISRVQKEGSCQGEPLLDERAKALFKIASEISPIWHVRMQAAFQRYCDNAVSKTINFPTSASRADILEAILSAYDLGCKGLTVYRIGSRQQEVLSMGTQRTKAGSPRPTQRPETLRGFTTGVRTGCGKLYVTVNSLEGPFEVFALTGGAGGCAAFTEGMGRIISLCLRSGISRDEIVEQLKSVDCKNFIRRAASDKTLKGKSCPYLIGTVLESVEGCAATEQPRNLACPDCGVPLVAEEGCHVCKVCGWSKCS